MSNWTPEQFKEYAQRRLKDEERTRTKLYEASHPMAGLQNTVREPQARSLVKSPHRKATRHRSPVIRVFIISFRHRLLDDDNLTAGAKQIRDAVAESFHCSDAKGSGIEWEYDQALTRGTEGTLVRIESL